MPEMNEEKTQQLFLAIAEMNGNVKSITGDIGDIKRHLEMLNGKTASTLERVTVLETELKPIKTIVNRVVWGVISSFLATVAYIIYKR